MQNNGSMIRYVSVCLICTIFILYSAFSYLFSPLKTSISQASPLKTTEKETQSEKEEKAEITTSSQTEENIDSSTKSEAEPTATKGTVKGKIIEQSISPYSAPVSYGKVYLKNTAGADINIKSLLSEKLTFKIEENSQPQVLIMHTHTTESYMDEDAKTYTTSFTSRTRDNEKNMVRIGDIVAKKLNAAGIKTLHDVTQHDYPQYTGSYTRSAKTVNSYLEKYPSIKIVLDLHRDAISSGDTDKVKLVTEIEGKKAAQVMLVMGAQTGNVTNFPNWQENLKLALRLQQTMEKKYPTLARPLSLVARNYNQSLSNGSMLIEFGTDANALKEAEYSAELVGNCLAELLGKI
ncbi:MAG: stage II sporulation protein P [Clostridia bacterium]|nr:stage II sporulation protein P [Clostridia bacterium]